jgi:hypothetical protein
MKITTRARGTSHTTFWMTSIAFLLNEVIRFSLMILALLICSRYILLRGIVIICKLLHIE